VGKFTLDKESPIQGEEPDPSRDGAGHGCIQVSGEQKITFGAMRAAGVRSVLIYCTDYACGHHIAVPDDADRWPDELRISDVEDKFVCTVCGQRGADIRPDWPSAERIFASRKSR
jgi:hypothetical protein